MFRVPILHPHAEPNAPAMGVGLQVAALLAVELTALAAAETRLLMALLLHQHAEPIVPLQGVGRPAAVRLAAELTVLPAVEA